MQPQHFHGHLQIMESLSLQVDTIVAVYNVLISQILLPFDTYKPFLPVRNNLVSLPPWSNDT